MTSSKVRAPASTVNKGSQCPPFLQEPAPLLALVPWAQACPVPHPCRSLSLKATATSSGKGPGFCELLLPPPVGTTLGAVTSASRRLSQGAQGGKRGGVLAAGQGGCNLLGLGLSSRGLGRENNEGSPKPPPRGRCWCKLPLPTSLLFCVCVYWGVRGILLFAFVSLFFFSWFGLWLAPDLGSGVWRGSDASRVRLENYLKEWTGNWHGNGGSNDFCGASVQGGSFRAL